MNRAASEALFIDQTRHLSAGLLKSRRWTVFELAYPVVDVGFEREGRTPFRVRLQCDDWNELPPSIALLSWDGTRLKTLPTGSGVFNSSPHPATGHPFICMAGAREYHIHSSHVSDHWENCKTKTGYDLGGILYQLWSAWLKASS